MRGSFALLLLLASAALARDVTYTFGVNLALLSTTSQTAQIQLDTLRGYEIWRDWWNALPADSRTTKWGETFKVALHVETFSNYGYEPWMRQALFDVYSNMASNSSIDYLFGPSAWEGVNLRRYAYETLGVGIMMCPTDSSEDYYSIPGSFGTPTANIATMASWLPYLRIGKAKTVSFLLVDDGVYQSEMCKGAMEQASLNGLTVLNYLDNMPFDWYTLGSINEENAKVWTSALDEVRNANPDAVIICDYNHGAEYSLRYMRDNDWTPKFVGVSPLNTGKVFDDPTLLGYVTYPAQFSAHALYAQQTNFTSSAGYDELSKARYGVEASPTMAMSTLAGMLFSHGLVNSPDNGTESLIDTIARSQFKSFMGISSFDVNLRQLITPLMLQLSAHGDDDPLIVGPPLAAKDTLIYPIPTWKERLPAPKKLTGVEIASFVLMAIGIAINVAWIVLILTHWNEARIRASSPLFCFTLLVGGIVVYTSIPTWMPTYVNSTTCSLRPILLPIGFVVIFGSLISKSDRIHRLFSLTTLDVIHISDLQVACMVVAIVLVQVILSVLATTVTGLTSSLKVNDVYRVSQNYYVCKSSSAAMGAILGVDIAYVAALLAWGSYLAYYIRMIPHSAYDESKTIIFSIYNAAVFCTITIVIQLAVGNSNRQLTFMVTSACIFIGVNLTTSALFVPKFKSIYYPTEHSTGGTSYNSSVQMELLKKENTDLKETVKKLSANQK